jgi:hypothetical protein
VVEVVDVVVVVDGAQSEAACWRLVPASPESVSNWDWSEVRVAWRATIADPVGDAAPDPDPDGDVVAVVEVVWDEAVELPEDVEVVAVSLASALANVAWVDANEACAEIRVAFSAVSSSDARVWPAVTVWPTDTSTALTVPETLKFRLAWLTGVIVPTESRVATTVPVPATAVR